MPTCQYNCVDLPDHELIDCGQYLKGGIETFGVLECDHSIADFTSASEINSAIASGELTLVKGIKGVFPDPSPVEGENPLACGATNILDGFDLELQIKDFNVRAENDTFYEKLNQRSSFLLWYECESEKLKVVERIVTWAMRPANVPESNKEKQLYLGTVKWSANVDEFPTMFDTTNTKSIFT